MSQGISPGYVLPTPQRAKLVGTLNIIFASLTLLYILFQIAALLLMPAVMQMSGDFVKQAQAKAQQQRNDQLEQLKKEAAEAKTAAEKAEIEKRSNELANAPQPPMPDMSKVTDSMKAPAYQAYVWSDFITGFALNVAMLISGIGLLQLKEWSRKLALWTFGLKIFRLVTLSAVMIIVIVPITNRMTSDMMADMTKGGPGSPPIVLSEMAKFQAAVSTIQAVLGAVFGSIWPIIGVVLLTRRGTRAACQVPRAKPSFPEQYLS